MTNEALRTAGFAALSLALVVVAARMEPPGSRSEIFSDQGEALFPGFTSVDAVKAIEVIDYDEAEATARPLKVEFRKGRWVLVSHSDYPAEARDRLAKTSAALLDLKRDLAVSDRWEDQAAYGVIDPLDAKNASLQGRGKRVTLRDAQGGVLADLVLGKAMKEKPGLRYARLPGQKRIYAVKTEADPSARFEDWVEADLLKVNPANVARMTLVSYSIDEQMGRLVNMQRVTMVKDKENWNAAAKTAAAALGSLRVTGARAKPKMLADQLRSKRLEMSLETVMSLRQRGFYIAPTGQLLANEGELIVEMNNGLVYSLRFGEIATSTAEAEKTARTGGESRYLFVTASSKSPESEERARALDARFADWYYIISGPDFLKLKLGIKPKPPAPVQLTLPGAGTPGLPGGQPPQAPANPPAPPPQR